MESSSARLIYEEFGEAVELLEFEVGCSGTLKSRLPQRQTSTQGRLNPAPTPSTRLNIAQKPNPKRWHQGFADQVCLGLGAYRVLEWALRALHKSPPQDGFGPTSAGPCPASSGGRAGMGWGWALSPKHETLSPKPLSKLPGPSILKGSTSK